jgi:phospholipid/cholesterol/gamma-HCH transport system substrate-binding protein
METIVGIFVLAGLICVAYVSIRLGNISLFHHNTYTLYARFSTVGGLLVGNPVEVFGVEEGKVSYVGIDNERQAALVGMSINKGVTVYGDAAASIKTQGLIGDKYLKIDPGGAEAPLKPGGMITNTVVLPDIEDLIGQYIFGQVKSKSDDQTGSKK